MPEPTGCFIDYEPPELETPSGIRYRQRPKDSSCLHEQVDFGKPQHGAVDVCCLGCGHRWEQCKVTTRTLADEGARR